MPAKKKKKKVTAEDVENLEKVVARLKKDNKQLRDALRKEINKSKTPRDHKRKSSSTLLKKQLTQALSQISNMEKEKKTKKKRSKRRPEKTGDDSGALRSKLIKVQKELDNQKKANRKHERKIKKAKVKISELLDKIAKANANARNLKRELGAARAKYDKLASRIEKLKKLKKPIPAADKRELKKTASLITELERRLGIVMEEIEKDKAEEEKMKTTIATSELELRRAKEEENQLSQMVTHLEETGDMGGENVENIGDDDEDEDDDDEDREPTAIERAAELDSLEKQILQLTNDHDEMEADLELKAAELQLRDQEYKELSGTNEMLEAQIEALKMQVQKLELEGPAVIDTEEERKKEQAVEELAELREVLEGVTKEKESLVDEKKKLQQELEESQLKLDDLPKLEADFESMKLELGKLGEENEKFKKLEVKMHDDLKNKVEEVRAKYEGDMKAHIEEMKLSYENQMTEKIMEEKSEVGKLQLELEPLKLELNSQSMQLECKDLEVNTLRDENRILKAQVEKLEADKAKLKAGNDETREAIQKQLQEKVQEVKEIYENQVAERGAKMKEQFEEQMNLQLQELKLQYEKQLDEMRLKLEAQQTDIKQVHVEVAIDASEREKDLQNQIKLLQEELQTAKESMKYVSGDSVADVVDIPESERLPEIGASRTDWLEWFVRNMKDEDLLALLEKQPEILEKFIYIYGQNVAAKANQANAVQNQKLRAEVNRANQVLEILRPVLKSLGLRGGDLQTEEGLSHLSAILQILQKQVLEFQGRIKELEGEKKRLATKLKYTQEKLAKFEN